MIYITTPPAMLLQRDRPSREQQLLLKRRRLAVTAKQAQIRLRSEIHADIDSAKEPAKLFQVVPSPELEFPEGTDDETVQLATSMWSAAKNSGKEREKTLQDIATLLPAKNFEEDMKVLNMLSHRSNTETRNSSDLDERVSTIRNCATEKQRLTAEIVNARHQQRDARVRATMAKARVDSIAFETPLLQEQQTVLTEARDNQTQGWTDLMATAVTFVQNTSDALLEMDAVDADVATYLNAANSAVPQGVPPEASQLTSLLTAVRGSVTALQSEPAAGWVELEGVRIDSTTDYAAALNTLTTRINDLQAESTAQNATWTSALAAIAEHEASEVTFMTQRNVTDAQCEDLGLNATDFSEEMVSRTRSGLGGMADDP